MDEFMRAIRLVLVGKNYDEAAVRAYVEALFACAQSKTPELRQRMFQAKSVLADEVVLTITKALYQACPDG